MIKKFINGIIFGAGFALAFLTFIFIGIYYIWPTIMAKPYEQVENQPNIITSAPPIYTQKKFLGSTGAHSTDFHMDRNNILSSGPGVIKGVVLVNGNPKKEVKLRLALNGDVLSQWTITNSSGEYVIHVPYGKYSIDGYELDRLVANKVLAGKIDHPRNPHSGAVQDVNKANMGYGLNFNFVDPVIKKTKKQYLVSEEIILEWEPYPNASDYSVQLFEKKDPNVWSNKTVFPHTNTPVVAEARLNLKTQNIKLKPKFFYVLQVYARDPNGAILSESNREYNGYDFVIKNK